MTKTQGQWRAFAGVNGFLAVVMGAVGAHGIADAHLSALVEKASMYQLMHSVVLLYISALPGKALRAARWLCGAGILVFCGSLYLKGLTGMDHATAFAPLGGVSFMASWLMIAITR